MSFQTSVAILRKGSEAAGFIQGGSILPAYCLFCETQKCTTITRVIERSWGIPCIFPEIIQRKWVKGTTHEVRHSMLPGYIFIYPEEPLEQLIRIPGIIRTLGNGELKNEDLAFAVMLKENHGVIGTIHLVEAGDRCTVADPLWEKMEGKVIKMDRQRRRCCVEFLFDGIRRTVWLGYNLVLTVGNIQNTDRLSKRENLMNRGERLESVEKNH